MNNWLLNQGKDAFPTYQKAVAMRLHFTTDYSYPRYNGKTNVSLETFVKSKDFAAWSRLHKTLLKNGLHTGNEIENFMFSYFKQASEKYFSIHALMAEASALKVYDVWAEKYSTFERFGDTYRNFITSQHERLSKLPKDPELPRMVSWVAQGIIDMEILAYYLSRDNMARGCWNANHGGNFVYDEMMRKAEKLHDYYHWKAIL